jgi:hypothetical protein
MGGRLLLALLGAPVAWTVHLLAAYVIVAAWCAAGWPGAGLAIGALTVVCAAAAVAAGMLALRLWRRGQARLVADAEPGGPEGWDARMGERGALFVFLAVVGLFMAALFTYLIVLQGVPPLLAPVCPATTMP